MDIADFSLDLFSLAGRNALVTGGNTGLGRAFSVALATAGADVFAVALAEDDGTTRALIEHAGRRMEFMAAAPPAQDSPGYWLPAPAPPPESIQNPSTTVSELASRSPFCVIIQKLATPLLLVLHRRTSSYRAILQVTRQRDEGAGSRIPIRGNDYGWTITGVVIARHVLIDHREIVARVAPDEVRALRASAIHKSEGYRVAVGDLQ